MDDEIGLGIVARVVPDMVFRVSANGTYLDAKRGDDIEFLLPAEEFLGKQITQTMPESVSVPAMIAIKAALADHQVHSFEYSLETPEGKGYFDARVVADGPDEVVITIRDVTMRYQSQADMALQSAVAENMAEGAIMVRTEDDSLVWANPRMESMLGYPSGDLVGQHLADLVADTVKYEDELLPIINSHLARTGRWLGETPMQTRSRQVLWCEISISRFNHHDHGTVLVALISDISERKANRVVEQALGQVGQLLTRYQTDVSDLLESLATAVSGITGTCSAIALFGSNGADTGGAGTEGAGSDGEQNRLIAINNIDPGCQLLLSRLAASPRIGLDSDGDDASSVTLTKTLTRLNIEQLLGFADGTNRETVNLAPVRSILVTPLRVLGNSIGAMIVVCHTNDPTNRDEDIGLLNAIADRAGPAIENARLYSRLLAGAELISNTQTGIVRLGSDLTILSWNPGAEAMTGFSSAETVGRHISAFGGSENNYDSVAKHFAKVMRSQEPVAYEAQRTHRNGTHYWAAVTLSPITGSRNTIVGMVVSLTDITTQRRAQTELEAMARSDALTGLANRAAFQESLGRSLARYRRYGVRGALLFLDVDGFKAVNDELGHQVGDEVLCELSKRLVRQGRATDTVARLGGDEFAILLDPVDDGFFGAVEVAQRLLDSLSQVYEHSGHDVHLSTSCGIAYFPEDGRDPDTLLKHADAAMYAAKKRGGGHAERYRHPPPQHDAGQDADPEERLRNAVRNREFRLHYQPIVDMTDRQLVGIEGLARWEHHDGSIDYPPDFLPLAERSGLIIPMGYKLFEDACEMAAKWSCEDADGRCCSDKVGTECLTVAVNLSRRQFVADDLVPRLTSAIERHNVDPSRITLEITETTAFDDVDQAIATLQQLRELHIQVALDDFGTGYSSLSALSEFSVDSLKIDRMFINKLSDADPSERHRHEAIITAAISMGHSMGLTVVAEGVEQESQHEFLVGVGCDRGQGWLYSDAKPASAVVEVSGKTASSVTRPDPDQS